MATVAADCQAWAGYNLTVWNRIRTKLCPDGRQSILFLDLGIDAMHLLLRFHHGDVGHLRSFGSTGWFWRASRLNPIYSGTT